MSILRGILLALLALSARAEFPRVDMFLTRSFFGPSGGTGVALSGQLAFLGAASVVNIYDVTDPRNPALRGSYNIPSPCLGITVRDQRAYLALGSAGLQIVDIANPAEPRLVGSFDTSGAAQDVAIVPGQIACVADGSGGLQVIDISDETQPRSVRSFPTSTACDYVLIEDSLACAGASDAVTIISLSDPANPAVIGSAPLPASSVMKGVAMIGSHLLVATGTPGLVWFDVSDPSAPRETGRIQKNVNGVVAHNRLAIALYPNEPRAAYDFADPLNPRVVGTTSSGSIGKSAFSGNLLFCSNLSTLLAVQLANPPMVGLADTAGNATRLCLHSGRAYIADNSAMAIYDVASGATPSLLGQFAGTFVKGVAASGNHAFIAAADGLTVVDIADPANPRFLANLPSPANAEEVVLRNSRAFVRSRAGISIVDIADPSNPQALGYYEAFNSAMKVLADGESICTAEGSTGRIVDVRNPAAPTPTASFAIRSSAYGMDIRGNHLFLAASGSGFFIYDLTDLNNVRQVSRLYAGTTASPMDVVTSGNLAYLALGAGGLTVLDISNPADPREIGHNNALSGGWNIHVSEGRVALSALGLGFAIFDEYRAPENLVLQPLPSQPASFGFRITGPPGVKGSVLRHETLGASSIATPFELGPGAVDIFETLSADRNAFFRAESR